MPTNLFTPALCFGGLLLLAACSSAPPPGVPGSPERGAAAISHYGCGSCHRIAGITGAQGQVGPPLSGIGSRLYVAGMLQNTPDNLARWVEHPTAINRKTVMPDLGVTHDDAVNIAAYLQSLK